MWFSLPVKQQRVPDVWRVNTSGAPQQFPCTLQHWHHRPAVGKLRQQRRRNHLSPAAHQRLSSRTGHQGRIRVFPRPHLLCHLGIHCHLGEGGILLTARVRKSFLSNIVFREMHEERKNVSRGLQISWIMLPMEYFDWGVVVQWCTALQVVDPGLTIDCLYVALDKSSAKYLTFTFMLVYLIGGILSSDFAVRWRSVFCPDELWRHSISWCPGEKASYEVCAGLYAWLCYPASPACCWLLKAPVWEVICLNNCLLRFFREDMSADWPKVWKMSVFV